MSLRRKSCDSCFKSRRKCDLGFPICQRCERNRKACHYQYPPIIEAHTSITCDQSATAPKTLTPEMSIDWDASAWKTLTEKSNTFFDFPCLSNDAGITTRARIVASVPNFIGPLGEIRPVVGNTKSWQWVIDQLKGYIHDFGQTSHNVFIHNRLYRTNCPQTIRAAFGVAAAYAHMTDDTRSMISQSMDCEILDLLKPDLNVTVLDNLSKMQALLVYQVIRLLDGDLPQQMTAELQENLLARRSLQLLQQVNIELKDRNLTFDDWILAENVRRTVIVTFMLHAVYAVFRHGICPEIPTLSVLPVSTNSASWESEATHRKEAHSNETVAYSEFTELWLTSPPKILQPYEKMLLVACKGLERVETLSLPNTLPNLDGMTEVSEPASLYV